MARIQTELGIFWLGTLRFNIDIIIFLMIYVFMNGMECTNEMVITNVRKMTFLIFFEQHDKKSGKY